MWQNKVLLIDQSLLISSSCLLQGCQEVFVWKPKKGKTAKWGLLRVKNAEDFVTLPFRMSLKCIQNISCSQNVRNCPLWDPVDRNAQGQISPAPFWQPCSFKSKNIPSIQANKCLNMIESMCHHCDDDCRLVIWVMKETCICLCFYVLYLIFYMQHWRI